MKNIILSCRHEIFNQIIMDLSYSWRHDFLDMIYILKFMLLISKKLWKFIRYTLDLSPYFSHRNCSRHNVISKNIHDSIFMFLREVFSLITEVNLPRCIQRSLEAIHNFSKKKAEEILQPLIRKSRKHTQQTFFDVSIPLIDSKIRLF